MNERLDVLAEPRRGAAEVVPAGLVLGERLGEDQDGAGAHEARDHLPPGVVQNNVARVVDVVHQVRDGLGLLHARVAVLADLGVLVGQEGLCLVALEVRIAQVRSVDQGSDVVELDGQHASLCAQFAQR